MNITILTKIRVFNTPNTRRPTKIFNLLYLQQGIKSWVEPQQFWPNAYLNTLVSQITIWDTVLEVIINII
jgi:hypothetical protein